MPLVFAEFSVDAVLNNYTTQVVKPLGYTGLYVKKVGGIWTAYTTQPSGTLVTADFSSVLPNPPSSGVVYNPTFGDAPIVYSSDANVELYFDNTTSKWKCGRPADR